MSAQRFIQSENGAVTVDWVVLTAALVGLAIAVVALISAGTQEPTSGLNASLSADIVADSVNFD